MILGTIILIALAVITTYTIVEFKKIEDRRNRNLEKIEKLYELSKKADLTPAQLLELYDISLD